jgi:FkbM family methyltransferase
MTLNSKTASDLWLKRVQPRWLREKLFWKFYAGKPASVQADFHSVSLDFAPGIRLKLEPSDIGHRQIAYLGYIEKDFSIVMMQHASKGGLLVDVGANYGYFTCSWAGAKTSNRVICFEASPRNLAGLMYNVALNNLDSGVVIEHKAAGSKSGSMEFSLGPADQTGWGGLALVADSTNITVEVVTLDESLKDTTEEIAVLKIDVEGADTWVLEGASSLLQQKRIGNVYFEQNLSRMNELGIPEDRALVLLRECGYTVNRFSEEAWHAYL